MHHRARGNRRGNSQRDAIPEELEVVRVGVTADKGQTVPEIEAKRLANLHGQERFPDGVVGDLKKATEIVQEEEQGLVRQRRVALARVKLGRDG